MPNNNCYHMAGAQAALNVILGNRFCFFTRVSLLFVGSHTRYSWKAFFIYQVWLFSLGKKIVLLGSLLLFYTLYV